MLGTGASVVKRMQRSSRGEADASGSHTRVCSVRLVAHRYPIEEIEAAYARFANTANDALEAALSARA